MSSTMLQLIQAATGEMGLNVPTYVAGNTNQDVTQQLALLNACGRELQRDYVWQALSKQYIFTVEYTTITADTTINSTSLTNCSSIAGIDTTYQVSGTGVNQATFVAAAPSGTTIVLSQPATSTTTGNTYTLGKVRYSMPSDYDRQIDRTHWDKSKHWEMLGPETAQQWEWLISGYISTGPRIRYRIFNSYFQIWPLVSTAEVLGFEYISNGWVTDVSGTAKTSFTVDTDTCIFPDNLMILALKKKYFEVKGFDSSAYKADYEKELSIAKANDGGSLTLSMNPRISTILIGWTQIPDSGYGS
jgi:hypothetical protein